ncbi:MAG: hypothetical protein JWQ87_2798 [Candidatus Sulfotelmatobacter sp.]|nr:hypothetical protein [Candidatus Sulfotelmatobacter sp.]
MKHLILALSLGVATLSNAADVPKSPVFIKGAACDGKLSSAAIVSLKEEIGNSQKYHVVPNLSDEGRMGVVITIGMACSERTEVAAIATTYGKGKCFPGAYCHQAVDGSSLKVALCDSNAIADCGRTLFKTFDDYASHMNANGASALQLQ